MIPLAILVAVLAAGPVLAQETFIVRLDDSANETVRGPLASLGTVANFNNAAGPKAQLLDGVVSVAFTGIPSEGPDSGWLTIAVDPSSQLDDVMSQWRDQPGVAYVQENQLFKVDEIQDPATGPFSDTLIDSLYHLDMIRAKEAWTMTAGSPDVLIGIVDTGILKDHPDLASQLWVNPGEDLNGNGVVDPSDMDGIDSDGNGFIDDIQGWDFVDRTSATDQGDYRFRDNDASDDWMSKAGPGRSGMGHGTLVAGAAAAALNNGIGVAGVAPNCRIVPIRAFSVDGAGEDDDIAAAIMYGADLGLDVLNLSFGDIYYSPLMEEAILYAINKGTTVVASGGNDGRDEAHYPSDYPAVVSVGWLSDSGQSRGFTGSYGVGLDLGAPGTRIYTTAIPPFTDEPVASLPDSVLYRKANGSSLAAPLVTGTVALLRSMDRSLTPAGIQAILSSTAVDITRSDEPDRWDHDFAAGRLDVAAALGLPYQARVSITSPDHNGGTSESEVNITGSALAPLFQSYEVSWAAGVEDPDDRWTTITESDAQVLEGTLATWDTSTLPDSSYIIRLAVTLSNGNRLEDRRLVFVDRTQPTLRLNILAPALDVGEHGILTEVISDDLTEVALVVERNGVEERVSSDRIARRHGVFWEDSIGDGGEVTAWVEATNPAGLTTVSERKPLQVPRQSANSAMMTADRMDLPHGFIMPQSPDFDDDGLKELVFNQYEQGTLSDTLRFFEWSGPDDGYFVSTDTVIADWFPRSLGDSDGDGLLEILGQISAATIVIEQTSTAGIPNSLLYLDTLGVSQNVPEDTRKDQALWGAAIVDLDDDGNGEFIGHNRKEWRVLERAGLTYREKARLQNFTEQETDDSRQLGNDFNSFSRPMSAVADFDGDGATEIVLGDVDGDFMIWETTGDDTFEPRWQYQTDRFEGGRAFATGDFDNDGQMEFWTSTQSWSGQLEPEREYAAKYSIYYLWDSRGNDSYALVDSVVLYRNRSGFAGMTVGDVDGDGFDELIVAHPPGLYVLSHQTDWDPAYYWQGDGDSIADGIRAVSFLADDFDGDGQDDIVAAGANEYMHFFSLSARGSSVPPPRWVSGVSRGPSEVFLEWRATGADSVQIFAADPTGPFNLIASSLDESLAVAATTEQRYRLRACYLGECSDLGETISVRPHAAAVVESITTGKGNQYEVRFSEPLQAHVSTDQLMLDDETIRIVSALVGSGGYVLALRLSDRLKATTRLTWSGLLDASGMPVGEQSALLEASTLREESLILVEWSVVDDKTAKLTFNREVDPVVAIDPSNYRVEPEGTVVSAVVDATDPRSVVVSIDANAIGSTGFQTTIVVENMLSQDGGTIASEGNVATLSTFADDLSDVYVFPNPLNVNSQATVMIAGLPSEATIEIFSPEGKPIRLIEESDGNGGAPWNLLDNTGQMVPSGVYLIRISSGDDHVMKKAAVIR